MHNIIKEFVLHENKGFVEEDNHFFVKAYLLIKPDFAIFFSFIFCFQIAEYLKKNLISAFIHVFNDLQ